MPAELHVISLLAAKDSEQQESREVGACARTYSSRWYNPLKPSQKSGCVLISAPV
jgi:hypothetical protein